MAKMGSLSTRIFTCIVAVSVLSCSKAQVIRLAMNPIKSDLDPSYVTVNSDSDIYGRNDILNRLYNGYGNINENLGNEKHPKINGRYVDYVRLNNMIKDRDDVSSNEDDLVYARNNNIGPNNNIIDGTQVDYAGLLKNIFKGRNNGFIYDRNDNDRFNVRLSNIIRLHNSIIGSDGRKNGIISDRDDFGRRNDIVYGHNDYIGRKRYKNDDIDDDDDKESSQKKCKAALLYIIAALQQAKENGDDPFTSLFTFKGKGKNRVLWRNWIGWNKSDGNIAT